MRKIVRCIFVLLFFTTKGYASNPTDYFRSVQSGNWNQTSTWESSVLASGPWTAATLTPDNNASTITIRNGHNVTALAAVTVDEVVIESGGTLTNSMPAANALTFNNGPGTDLEIQSGGMYHILSTQGYASYQTINAGATITIRSNGVIKVGDGTVFGGANNYQLASTSASYIWETNAEFQWNIVGAFATVGITYFPDANATTIPIFRVLVNPGSVGGGSATLFNGLFQADANVTFNSSATITFRNGIVGGAVVTQSGSAAFRIDGTTAKLGGGTLAPAGGTGLDIGGGTMVTMISDKLVTNRIDLLGPNSHIELLNYNLTVATTVNITEVTSWIKTNGTGKLTINSVSAAPFGFKIFPVGLSTVNPLFITSSTTANYSARVNEPVIPTIFDPTRSVQRTWYITCSVSSPAGTSIGFGYTYPTDCGINYNNSGANASVGVYLGSAWNVHELNLTPQPFFIGAGTYTVTPTTAINYFTAGGPEIPFAVANNGAFLPLDYFIVARAQKQGSGGLIRWSVFSTEHIASFEVQRSVNNRSFETIGRLNPVDQQLDYSFIDAQLEGGTSLYRIKVNRDNRDTKYSNTVALINGNQGLMITSVLPNPVHRQAQIILSSANTGTVQFEIYDLSGKIIKQWKSQLADGTNNYLIDLQSLPAGVYHILSYTPDAQAVYRFLKVN